MGSIVNIYTNKQYWHKTFKTAKLKNTGEELVNIIIGYANYDYEGSSDVKIWIRKSIYDKVLSGTYKISENSYFCRKLIILDEQNNKIEPILESDIY